MKQTTIILSLSLCILAHISIAQSASTPSRALPSSFLPVSYDTAHRHLVIQLGGYWGSQGLSQNISIEKLAGNQYTLTQHHHPSNGLVGLGYFLDGPNNAHFQMNYGVNGFYLTHTPVNGNIVVEHYFTDLNYNYQIQHAPVYLAIKALIKNDYKFFQVTFDTGIGIDFMHTFNYKETPLNTAALPQDNFAPHMQETFTAMAGIGIRLNHVFGQTPLECGYRFFYLGQGHLQINNDLYQNILKTGNNYANALLCSVTI